MDNLSIKCYTDGIPVIKKNAEQNCPAPPHKTLMLD